MNTPTDRLPLRVIWALLDREAAIGRRLTETERGAFLEAMMRRAG